ncbi:acid protease [Pluteus cervinus]|uniref:Acid protease n=1 Tax=Pluteus cervinus TaxID=181527 RepID=A0ACD3ATT5_9AGAR|nr:acid protease [Pluteus cervinus]
MLTTATGIVSVLFLSPGAWGEAQPQKVALTSRSITSYSSSSWLKRRGLSPTNVPLQDFFKGTDLQWYGNISVGTPPQVLPVVFDTGSTTLEFASTQCGQPCTNQIQFDTTKSSSFVAGVVNTSLVFGTGGGVDPVVGSNYKITIQSGKDTVEIGGLKADNVDLFLITNQSEPFAIDPYSGIQGMGATAQGLFAALVSQGLPALFGLYITPQSVGGAELTLGGVDNSKFSGNLTYAALPPRSGSTWQLSSPSIAVNGNTTSVLTANRTIIFDSGSSNLFFPKATTEARRIYLDISDIQPNTNEPGAYGIACDRVSSLPAVIDFAFTAQDGSLFNLTVPSSELSVGPFANDPSTCQLLINALEEASIVGGSLFKHYYTAWDIGGQQIGFASLSAKAPAPSSSPHSSGQALRSNWIPLSVVTLLISVVTLL